MSKERSTFSRSRLFKPKYVRRLTTESTPTKIQNANSLSGSAIISSSFRYDPAGTGFKSTQQIPIDWSRFENHTFFDSAESKVNVTFDAIINKFPFDGTKLELEDFLDNLTGYEKYVYDVFPKRAGYLYFSGTHNSNVGTGTGTSNAVGATVNGTDPVTGKNLGTWIHVNDFAGSLFPTISKNRSGKAVIDPGAGDLSIEFHLSVPEQKNDNQVILQKLSGDDTAGDPTKGITMGLIKSTSDTKCELLMMVSSKDSTGDIGGHISASMDFPKGKFNHVYASFNRKNSTNIINLYLNGELISSSSKGNDFGAIDFKQSPLTIGSGSKHQGSTDWGDVGGPFTPEVTLSGAMDELRIWHESHTPSVFRQNMNRGVFADPALRLYYKFNEPLTGSEASTVDNVIIDSSGMSMHAKVENLGGAGANSDLHRGPIYNDAGSLLISGTVASPLVLEDENNCPILFPDNEEVQKLNVELLNLASQYDVNNPNLITRLIPKHFLLESSADEGYTEELGDTFNKYGNVSDYALPGLGDIPSPQIITTLLFTWAKYFDEIKIFVDHFSNLLWVDYDTNDVVADQFIPFLADYYGFELPNMFGGASLKQLLEGENLSPDASLSPQSLQYVQNQIWKRVLINFNDIIRSKGTIHGIKALLRAVGIRPNSLFRFREYGGSSTRELKDIRKSRTEVSTLLDFSGSSANVSATETLSPQGVSDSKPFLMSPFLSGTRVEPGIPYPAGNNGTLSVHPVTGTNNPGDGLFTSGSWSYEAFYKFENTQIVHATTQSLARMHNTGALSSDLAGGNLVVANLVALKPDTLAGTTGSLFLYAAPGDINSKPMSLHLSGVDIFDGNKWHVSFGCQAPDGIVSLVSSSYFLRATRQNFGSIVASHSTSSYYSGSALFSERNVHYQSSGSFIVIGSQSINTRAGTAGLGNSSWYHSDDNALMTHFDGRVGHIRFWSKALTQTEEGEHTKNFKSLGVFDPLINFNFVTHESGSFEKLRLDVSTDQMVTQSNVLGNIELFDFTQQFVSGARGAAGAGSGAPWILPTSHNKMFFHMSGSGFEPGKQVVKPERFDYSILDPKFDEASVDNKIRIRSFEHYENIVALGGEVAPIYEVRRSEEPVDDTRFSIDVSSVQALNEDMVNIISTIDALDNVLGNPELLFATEYPDLKRLREVYFNRLTDKIRWGPFFDFYKWFDVAVGSIIEDLVPRKTKFLGVNFVIESHMFERSKFNYTYSDIYLGENDRRGLHGQILLQQLIAYIRKM